MVVLAAVLLQLDDCIADRPRERLAAPDGHVVARWRFNDYNADDPDTQVELDWPGIGPMRRVETVMVAQCGYNSRIGWNDARTLVVYCGKALLGARVQHREVDDVRIIYAPQSPPVAE